MVWGAGLSIKPIIDISRSNQAWFVKSFILKLGKNSLLSIYLRQFKDMRVILNFIKNNLA
jgi:hypothetical protein